MVNCQIVGNKSIGLDAYRFGCQRTKVVDSRVPVGVERSRSENAIATVSSFFA